MSRRNWIFLRGLTRGNIHWGDFPEIFKKITPEAAVEFLEIPGNGNLCNEITPINAKEVVDLIRKKSQFCQENLPVNICGISLGGMIALKWAELYPENTQSVTIINSSLKQFSPFYHRLLPANYVKILKAACESNISEQEKFILSVTSNKIQETSKYLKTFSDFATEHKMLKKNIVKQLILASKIHINKFPNIPLKVINSKNDRLVSSSCSEKIAINLNGKIFIHPTAGHDLPLDEPFWLSEVLTISD
jgi:pimeloyl-ACP methyl ester carboxylesterase